MNKWIDCFDDNVPKNKKKVLVYSESRGYEVAKYSYGTRVYSDTDIMVKFWWRLIDNDEEDVLDDVLYWMPLPEPPKENRDES